MSIRRITFGGNLTADPEVRQAGGNTVCNFSIACDDYQGGQEVTDFIDCDAWGKVGQSIADNFKKGSRIFVSTGSLQDTSRRRAPWETRVKKVVNNNVSGSDHQ